MNMVIMSILAMIIIPCLLGIAILVLELMQGEVPMVDSERNRVLRKIPRQRRSSDQHR